MSGEQRSPNGRNSADEESRQASSDLYQQRQQPKMTRNKKSKSANSDASNYYWTDRENRSYLKFLREKGAILRLSPVERKRQKTNLKLSKYIKTRTATQCHTHHQKMMVKYGSIEKIIQELAARLDFQVSGRGRPPANRAEKEAVATGNVSEGGSGVEKAGRGEEGGQGEIMKEENDLQYIYY